MHKQTRNSIKNKLRAVQLKHRDEWTQYQQVSLQATPHRTSRVTKSRRTRGSPPSNPAPDKETFRGAKLIHVQNENDWQVREQRRAGRQRNSLSHGISLSLPF